MRYEEITRGCYSYVFEKVDGGVAMYDSLGFAIEADDLLALSKELAKYARKHRKDIEIYNLKRKIEHEKEFWH